MDRLTRERVQAIKIRHDVLHAVVDERDRQDAEWGEQSHDDFRWQSILLEEVGEVARALNAQIEPPTEPVGDLEHELVQVAAVAICWLECIERRWKEACHAD